MICRLHIHIVVLCPPDSWSNWNLEMLVFEERGKPEYPEKNLSEQRREPTTNSTHIWRWRQDLNPGHIGGRRVLSPLRHPCSPLGNVEENYFALWGGGIAIYGLYRMCDCSSNYSTGYRNWRKTDQFTGISWRFYSTLEKPGIDNQKI